MDDEYINGIKIQRLPTYGNALSIKTRKQGRTKSIDSILTSDQNLMGQDIYIPKGKKRKNKWGAKKNRKVKKDVYN